MLLQQRNAKRELANTGYATLAGLSEQRDANNRAAQDQERANQQAARAQRSGAIGQGIGLAVTGVATGNPFLVAAGAGIGVLSLF